MFQGASRFNIRIANPPFDGRTLNGSLPCPLMHVVQRCDAGPGCERQGIAVSSRHSVDALIDLLAGRKPTITYPPRGEYCVWPRENVRVLNDSELRVRLTRVPHRHPWSDAATKLYNRLLDEKKEFPVRMELSAAPSIFRDRPRMPFIATEVKATGRMQGLIFKQKKKLGGTGTVWLIADCALPAKVNRADSVERQNKKAASNKLVCISCAENFVERYGEGFVLCDDCESFPVFVQNGWNASDWAQNFDFTGEGGHKDNGFQEERNYKRKSRSKTGGAPAEGKQPMPVSLAELYSRAERPLLEDELAWLLAAKHPGFTRRNSPAYLKAQATAAKIAGRFLFGRGFAELARMIPGATEDSVRKLCQRAREDYMRSVRECRGIRPDDAGLAMRKGLLRGLYPPALVTGHFCRSANCCTA